MLRQSINYPRVGIKGPLLELRGMIESALFIAAFAFVGWSISNVMGGFIFAASFYVLCIAVFATSFPVSLQLDDTAMLSDTSERAPPLM